MGDSSSADTFGRLFEAAAKLPACPERDTFVRTMWIKAQAYDFCNEEMNCDGTLIALGLARWDDDPENPDDEEETLFYGPVAAETNAAPPPSDFDMLKAEVATIRSAVAAHVHDRGMHQQRGGK